MVLVSTQIEIARSPEQVRQIFLDFPKIPEWSTGGVRSIEPAVKDKPTIEKHDKLNVALDGISFSPSVLENSTTRFVWRGDLYGLFKGDHGFRFEPSKTTPGSTTFIQSEDFSGPLSLLLQVPLLGLSEKTAAGFTKFNECLKERAERSA